MLAPLRLHAQRGVARTTTTAVPATRAYSYFSQRPGRFFTPARRPTAGSDTNGSGSAKVVSSASGSGSGNVGSGDGGEHALVSSGERLDHVEATAASSSSSASSSSETNGTGNVVGGMNNGAKGLLPTAPLLHPQPPLPSLHLHDFFAQHRPLLLLDQALPQLFTRTPASALTASWPPSPPSSSLSPSSSSSQSGSLSQSHFQSLTDASLAHALGIDVASQQSEAESDADVARMLARAQVVHRIQASRDWSTVLTDLGLGDPKHGMGVHDEQAVRDALISLDSVKRKRRKKMNKHKYKKRRKVQRAERRRLGK